MQFLLLHLGSYNLFKLLFSYLGKDVTKDALDAFIAAVIDLTTLGLNIIYFNALKEYNFTIKFNFVNFIIENKNLKYNYDKLFIEQLNDKGFEKKVIFFLW